MQPWEFLHEYFFSMAAHESVLTRQPTLLLTYLQPTVFLHLPFLMPSQTGEGARVVVGELVGAKVGIMVGAKVGVMVGAKVGVTVGAKVGVTEGATVGVTVGEEVGLIEGHLDGEMVAMVEGAKVVVGVVTVEFVVTVELRLNSMGLQVSSFKQGMNGMQASSSEKYLQGSAHLRDSVTPRIAY